MIPIPDSQINDPEIDLYSSLFANEKNTPYFLLCLTYNHNHDDDDDDDTAKVGHANSNRYLPQVCFKAAAVLIQYCFFLSTNPVGEDE